jgi:hypothetical protein
LLDIAITGLLAWAHIFKYRSGLAGAIEVTIRISFFEESENHVFLEFVETIVPQSSKLL